ncbi:MAG: RagB/SusD family nutrient uptake outer membrane protein [Rikenellaceae bacterium]
MKLKNRIIPGLLLLASLSLSSCDDFLTQVNPNEITSSSYYTSISDCESSLAAVYNQFKDMDCYRIVEEIKRSDIGTEGSWAFAARTNFSCPYYMQTFGNADAAVNDKWEALYKGVFRANQLIDGLNTFYPSISDDATREDWNTIMGEARFFRGLFHYWLSICYNNGVVPIVESVPTDEASLYMPLPEGGADEVRDFCRAEFLAALEYGLPESWPAAYAGRITSGTVKTYLGQSYLYEGDYSTAMGYFKDVIDSGVYSLAHVSENTASTGEFNSESILEVNYTLDYNTEFTNQDQRMSNTWHTNFSRTTGAYFTVLPAGWFALLCQDEDPVDPENDMNWSEVTLDEDGNVIYLYLGKDYSYTTTNADGSYSVLSYVFQKYDEEDAAFYGYEYSRDIMRLTRYYDAAGVLDEDATTYVSHEAYFNHTTIKEVDGKYYKLMQKTPRGAYRLAQPTDEDILYYQTTCGYAATWQGGHLGYFREMTNYDIWTMENDSPTTGQSGVNLRLMTLSDVYLMYAECLVQTGGSTQTALDYINKLRYRGGAVLLGTSGEYDGLASYDGESYSADDIMKQIMYVERPLEVGFGQATRVCDLRRWGITKQRFAELSTTDMYMGPCYYNYPATSGIGLAITAVWRWEAKAYNTETAAYWNAWYPATQTTTYHDYQLAALNYTDENNAYFPIPNEEILANPNLN